jgi:hypothetical protein
MITDLQKITIQTIYDGFLQNVRMYRGWGSSDVCSFVTLHNEKSDEDKNVAIQMVLIDDISDNMQLFTKTMYILVEPDGKQYLLETLFSETQVITYVQKLTKFDWNG